MEVIVCAMMYQYIIFLEAYGGDCLCYDVSIDNISRRLWRWLSVL